MRRLPSIFSLTCLVACAHPVTPDGAQVGAAAVASIASPGSSGALHPGAVEGVTDPALRQLLSDHWWAALERSPELATELGEHAYDDQLSDNSPAAHAAALLADEALLERAQAIDATGLSPSDALNLRLFTQQLMGGLAEERACAGWQWNILPRDNPLTRTSRLAQIHPRETAADRRALLSRFRQLAGQYDVEIANLQVGLDAGRVANAESVRRVIEMVDSQLGEPIEKWPLVSDLDGYPVDEIAALTRVVDGDVRAGMQRYRDFLAERVAPVARTGADVGLSGVPGGDACYVARVRNYTSLDRSPADVHARGLAALKSVQAEILELGGALFEAQSLRDVATRVREDSALRFDTEDAVEARAVAALAAAQAAAPEWFGVVPAGECVVQRVPAFEAPYTTIAYYWPVTDDKPGEYFVNTWKPETRPTFEAEVLAFHESVPGHHLQIARARELDALPAFRRYSETTAFVEGWALYTERLSDEMGLYTSDLDRLGMLSFDAWRAARLVVDTGVHHLGWSREEAVAFMLENTLLAPNNIDNEIDRYITWPAQALAYKTGQLEIIRMRAEAEATLGERFDIKRFHDVVLEAGAIPLPELDQRVRGWVEGGGQ